MKRHERLGAGRTDREPDVAAEVHVTVTDGGGRAVASGWRYLALAILILAAAATVVVTSLRSGGRRSASAPPTRAAGTARSTSGSSCVHARGYGGLGGRTGAFDANNNNEVGRAEPSPGAAFYMVTGTAKGCVTAFAVQDSATPPLTAGDLLVLVSHPYLPLDAQQVVNSDRCAIWKSAALRRATGRAYAQATAIAQAGSVAGRAQIEATANPTC